MRCSATATQQILRSTRVGTRCRWFGLLPVLAGCIASVTGQSLPAADQPAADAVIQIGSRRELFLDRALIHRLDGLDLRLQTPRDEGIALRLDGPHEGPQAGYTTVLRDDDRWLMYYRGISQLGLDGSPHERTCVAISEDGIRWSKPALGLYEFEGSRENNIVLADAAPATHNLSPFLDTRPDCPANERFKALGGTLDSLAAFVSADGYSWRRFQAEPVLTRANVPFPHIHLFDSQNVAYWSPADNAYVCYFRVWDGVRRVAKTTSRDFRQWTPAVLMQTVHDDGQSGPQPAPDEQIYTNQSFPYFRAPQLVIALAARFFEGRQVLSAEQAAAIRVNPDFFRDTSDCVLMTSRGGHTYDRTFLEGFLKPGIGWQNWVSRTNYPALNVHQTGPSEMSFYVNQDYAQPTAHVRRYSLRLDGFAALHAGAREGELITRPLTFQGDELRLNFATSAAGGIRVELQNVDGASLPGFGLADCPEIIGNEIERTVRWTGQADLEALAGQPVCLRIMLRDADLFALQFVETDAGR